ncbi:hypothetical protein KEJ50_03160 [Candidatus Bathyarchaeota archaeon]|nr:hypothetical protein [Candidatus Bathyarchaeota archaeon]
MKVKKAVLDVLETCKAVEEHKLNPFLVDVFNAIKILREYFSLCKDFKDYCLDAKALNALSKVVELQNAYLLFQSSKLYVKPEDLKNKVYSLNLDELAKAFLKSWHPLIEMEQLTFQSINNCLLYWSKIQFYRREKSIELTPEMPKIVEESEVSKKSEEISALMTHLWREMIELAGKKGKVDYWVFICKGDFQTIVKRAYVTSFLVTYGYASLVKNKERLYLYPNKKVEKIEYEKFVANSFPISIKKSIIKGF